MFHKKKRSPFSLSLSHPFPLLPVSVAEPVAERYTGGGGDMGGAASVGWSKVPRCSAPSVCLLFFSDFGYWA
ncbi:hypothetical protein ES332_A08G051400v1 [Gossypium tomentosum]|uniref:Uncharacterized protein n=1 Tax=Gossypium tomentosum TaxID=34277 RepID=A0A5D2PBX3_GOSTO|nr:hypothetical protein ES332_A08G051400v1 [Gossypium tomentosum]